MPSLSLLANRFGSLSSAWQLVGHNLDERRKKQVENARKARAVKRQIIEQILSLYPKQIKVSRPSPFCPVELQIHNGLSISLKVPSLYRYKRPCISWKINTRPEEINKPVLICRRSIDTDQIEFFLFPKTGFKGHHIRGSKHDWWTQAQKLSDLTELLQAVYKLPPNKLQ
jgi:hypothetical protein